MRVPLTYRDATGTLTGELETDGRTLRVVVDGTRFEGRDLDGLEPVGAAPARFMLATGSLCACELAFALPIAVLVDGGERAAALAIELQLGAPRPDGGITRERLALSLAVGDRSATSTGKGYFEDALVELERAMPGVHLKTCFGCGLSDYSPYGHGLFGTMMCFRGRKAEYRAVRTKDELFAIHDDFTELVQETHVCGEFERRSPGTGYRG